MPTQPTEHELLTGAIGGDQLALEQLLLTHYGELSRHISRRLPSFLRGSIGCEDIMQETFVHACRDIHRFEPRSDDSFLAWLRKIADHRLQDTIKAFRRKKRPPEDRRIQAPSHCQASSLVDLLEMLLPGSHTPSRSVARHEAIRAVQVAIAGLPDVYREVVSLRYLQDKDLKEVATHMGRSVPAVRGLLDRAKRKMRASMDRSSLYFSRK